MYFKLKKYLRIKKPLKVDTFGKEDNQITGLRWLGDQDTEMVDPSSKTTVPASQEPQTLSSSSTAADLNVIILVFLFDLV